MLLGVVGSCVLVLCIFAEVDDFLELDRVLEEVSVIEGALAVVVVRVGRWLGGALVFEAVVELGCGWTSWLIG